MFEFAKQQLQTTITPHLTSLNQTITTLRTHPTVASKQLMSSSQPAQAAANSNSSISNNFTAPISLSEFHPLIPSAGKSSGGKKSIDSDAAEIMPEPVDTTTAPDFSHIYFESELFKITLSDAEYDSLDVHGGKGQGGLHSLDLEVDHGYMGLKDLKSIDIGTGNGPYAPPGSVFYIHKALLASLSPELRKHTDNQMKEGLRGEMVLGEVDRPTMQRFLQWAYRGEYTV